MALRPNAACPECKKNEGKDRPNLIYRSWRNDYICGWCKAFYIEKDGHLVFMRYQWELK